MKAYWRAALLVLSTVVVAAGMLQLMPPIGGGGGSEMMVVLHQTTTTTERERRFETQEAEDQQQQQQQQPRPTPDAAADGPADAARAAPTGAVRDEDVCVVTVGSWNLKESHKVDRDSLLPESDTTANADLTMALITHRSLENRLQYCALHGCRVLFFNETLDPSRPAAWSKIIAVQWALFGEPVVHVPLDRDLYPAGAADAADAASTSDSDGQPPPRCAWVLWMDLDAFFTNMTVSVAELINADLAAHELLTGKPSTMDVVLASHRPVEAPEFVGLDPLKDKAAYRRAVDDINTGVFVARASEWTKAFFERVWASVDESGVDDPLWEKASIVDLLLNTISLDESFMHVLLVYARQFNGIYAAVFEQSFWQPGDFVFHMTSCACCKPTDFCLSVLDRFVARQ